jgi:hypothetical protein
MVIPISHISNTNVSDNKAATLAPPQPTHLVGLDIAQMPGKANLFSAVVIKP